MASCFSSIKNERENFSSHYVLVPCGNCIGCRLDYSATWADRMLLESFDKEAFFITLTYDDSYLSYSENSGFYSLNYDDMDKFIKGLRNKFRDKWIRYLYSGEYGDSSLRPHYHLILYGLNFNDFNFKFYKLNDLFEPMYSSDLIADLWPFGFNVCAKANYHNLAYTAKYILKKQKGEGSKVYYEYDILPPSFRMSRRPGISYDWIVDNYKELYTKGYLLFDRSVFPTGRLSPNRYFDKVVDDLDPELLAYSKEKRLEESYKYFDNKYYLSSLDRHRILDYYEFEKKNFLSKNQRNSI